MTATIKIKETNEIKSLDYTVLEVGNDGVRDYSLNMAADILSNNFSDICEYDANNKVFVMEKDDYDFVEEYFDLEMELNDRLFYVRDKELYEAAREARLDAAETHSGDIMAGLYAASAAFDKLGVPQV